MNINGENLQLVTCSVDIPLKRFMTRLEFSFLPQANTLNLKCSAQRYDIGAQSQHITQFLIFL